MKKKLIESLPPLRTKKQGWWITLQEVENLLILNVFENAKILYRHALNLDTKEYATFSMKENAWLTAKVEYALGIPLDGYGGAYWYEPENRKIAERWNLSKQDHERILELLPSNAYWTKDNSFRRISEAETDHGRIKRQTAEERRRNRVAAMMERVPPLPKDWANWMDEKLTHDQNWILKCKATQDFHCSACGGSFTEWNEWDKLKDRQKTECPLCGWPVIVRKRKQTVEIEDKACLIQPIDEEVSVARHFKIKAEFFPIRDGIKAVESTEEVRIILFKHPKKDKCDLYYYQWSGFDNRGNPLNKKTGFCHLYDAGITEAFRDTAYESEARIFTEFARAGLHLDYNSMMIAADQQNYVDLLEMLFRGRFHRLLREESGDVYWWNGSYKGAMDLRGSSIREIFKLQDMQKINRIRDFSGGHMMLEWMRWSEKTGTKVTDENVIWLERNRLWPWSFEDLPQQMTVTQVMNYLKRQQRESYQGKAASVVISQWEDYLKMCKELKKDLKDEMVYKPRELKRRHQEAVKEIEVRRAELQAEAYSAKYGEAEAVLSQIKEKFEYVGEGFCIIVPVKIVDIVKEGNALHHCAGATDRYFDRIKQNETYICFLRKLSDPETPFYTIEVEPGGTIRQHRGMFDEEPEIEVVKPFLREWQKEIKRRMKARDRKLAAVSKEKREKNIEELKAANNTRVLKGLMEDFMEAM